MYYSIRCLLTWPKIFLFLSGGSNALFLHGEPITWNLNANKITLIFTENLSQKLDNGGLCLTQEEWRVGGWTDAHWPIDPHHCVRLNGKLDSKLQDYVMQQSLKQHDICQRQSTWISTERSSAVSVSLSTAWSIHCKPLGLPQRTPVTVPTVFAKAGYTWVYLNNVLHDNVLFFQHTTYTQTHVHPHKYSISFSLVNFVDHRENEDRL